ncbi:hypothetical protein T484DRAFT_1913079 [Baffinella frigidus]|nr:hypothetical protein T484DRAFT_1913079 [Cryptophyta sp. CCMP2293]
MAEGGGAASNAPRAVPRLVTNTLTVKLRQFVFDLQQQERIVGHEAFRGKLKLLREVPCCGEALHNCELFAMAEGRLRPPPPEAFSPSEHPCGAQFCAGPFSILSVLQGLPAMIKRFQALSHEDREKWRVPMRQGWLLPRTVAYPQVGKKLYVFTPVTEEEGRIVASAFRFCFVGSSDDTEDDATAQAGAAAPSLAAAGGQGGIAPSIPAGGGQEGQSAAGGGLGEQNAAHATVLAPGVSVGVRALLGLDEGGIDRALAWRTPGQLTELLSEVCTPSMAYSHAT